MRQIINNNCSLFTFHFLFKKVFLVIFSLFTFHFISAQDLEKLIEVALENNPKIQKFELQYNIASEKVNEVNTFPNTEFGAGYFVSEPETRTGAQRFKVSAKQMIPWFGSITARENYTSALADAKYEDIAIAKRKLVAAVSQSYYYLYANKAKQKVLVQNVALLKTYESLALSSVTVGKASAVDVLRLQMRQNELTKGQLILEQEFMAEQSLLNKLLNRDGTKEIVVVSELMIPSEKNKLLTFESLQLHPELVKYDKLYASVTQSELLNQKESSPMIGFGVDYIAVSERPDLSFSDNGKDIIMPMVSISIPLFNKKYKSRTKQNKLQQQEIKTQKQDRLNKLETALTKAINKKVSSQISYETQIKNLQQAKSAEEILIRSYETGTISFNDVLDIQELQLKFQINKIESVREYYIQTIIINYLTI